MASLHQPLDEQQPASLPLADDDILLAPDPRTPGGELDRGMTQDAAAAARPTPAADDDEQRGAPAPLSAADKGKGRANGVTGDDDEEQDEQRANPAPAAEKKVVRTVDDLEEKSCWICLDDDRKASRFVHPCNCTLIAHEACLLAWIASQQQTKDDREPVCCPQCKAEILIDENLSPVLKFLNAGDRYVSRASSYLLLGTIGSSVLTTSTLVGFSSMRLFFGFDVTRITLSGLAHGQNGLGAWRWWAWVGLPLVPVGLIVNSLTTSFLAEARIKVLESMLLLAPFFLLPRPALPHHPSTPRGPWLFARSVVGELWTVRWGVWPPGPGAVVVLLGVGEVAYLALKRELERFILGAATARRRSFLSWLFPAPRTAPPAPLPERRFLATPNPAGGVRFRVFEPDLPEGEGAEVDTDEVAGALARARAQGQVVQVRVWEDDGSGERRRVEVAEAPINWDDFDAAGPRADNASDDENADPALPTPSTVENGSRASGAIPDDAESSTDAMSQASGATLPSRYDDEDPAEDYDDEEDEDNGGALFPGDDDNNDGGEPDTDDELAAIELAIAAGPPAENGPVREGELPLEALFLSRLSLSRIAASALIMPALSALAGRALLWLAQTHAPSLARFLGVSSGGRRRAFGGFVGAAWWGAAGFGTPTDVLDELDPVWWRNTVGAAVLVVVRDSCSLLHKYLKIQGRRTRKIVERSLEGLDMH